MSERKRQLEALALSRLTQAPVIRVLDLLNRDGEEARIVGGAVRNALLGLPPGDIDIATTLLPDAVMRRAADAGLHAMPTGIEHGTVTLVVDEHPFEVTTLREDVETYGRKAKVAFGRSWEHDAARRDFTINAFSLGANGAVYDYVGGFDDLAARRIRFIGDAQARIAEDYLRILRFFRFHATYGEGAIDEQGLAACIAGRSGLAQLSAERVRAELLKLLVAHGAAPALEIMEQSGLLAPLLGGIAFHASLRGMIAAENALALAPHAIRRLGALAVWLPEDAARLSVRLRLSNAETRQLDSMAHGWWRMTAMDARKARARLYRLGAERYRDRVMLGFARAGARANARFWHAMATLPDAWTAPACPLKAADFLARGFAPGPALGEVLVYAENLWIDADYPLDPEAVSALADSAARDYAHDHRL